MGNVRISTKVRDEAGNVIAGDAYEVRAKRSGTTTDHTEYLDEAGAIIFTPPGRSSTSTSTTISASAASGQAIIQVASTTGFSVGDTVHVVGGGNTEEHLIRALLTGPTRIQLAKNLANTFATGTVGGSEDKGAWARYVPDTFNTDLQAKRVSDGKIYPVITFPTKAVGYTTVQDEGTDLTQRSKLDLIGPNVKGIDNGAGKTDVFVDALEDLGTWSGATPAIDFSNGKTNKKVVIAINVTPTYTPPQEGAWVHLHITQDATGNRTVTWGATWNWGNAGAPALGGANKIAKITAQYIGSTFYGSWQVGY